MSIVVFPCSVHGIESQLKCHNCVHHSDQFPSYGRSYGCCFLLSFSSDIESIFKMSIVSTTLTKFPFWKELWTLFAYEKPKSSRVGGPAQVFPPKRFFLGGRPTFSKRKKTPKKQTDAEQREALFWHDENRPPPPHRCDFTIDLQRCWSINRKIGDR